MGSASTRTLAAIPDPDVLTACLAESIEEVVAVGRHSAPEADAPTARTPAAEPSSGRRRLSALDTSFLALESATTPMHVGALIVLGGGTLTDADGRVRIDAIRDEIASRLSRCPRMRQRIAPVPFGAARPVWVDDVDFDISQHVRSVDLSPPGSREQLEQLCCELQMEVLDRTRPLWEMWFVGGLADGSVGLVYKVHHAVVDGVSAAETFELLLDPRTSVIPPAVAGRVGAIRRARRPGIVGLGRPRGRRANGGAGRVRWSRGAPAPRAGSGLRPRRRAPPPTDDARSANLAQPVRGGPPSPRHGRSRPGRDQADRPGTTVRP